MLTKNERMNKLKENGINVDKYFTVNLDNGTKIHLIIDENGSPKLVDKPIENDPIYKEIIEDGYVRNTRLHRRWIMAQMFSALNYISYDGQYKGYNDCLKRMYGYDYTLQMMVEEIRVLGKLEARDVDSFNERKHFFNKDVVIAVLEDYLEKLQKYIETMPNRNCKGIPYKRINGKDIFNADIDKKIYMPIRNLIRLIKYAKNYSEIHRILEQHFMKNHIKLPFETTKSKVWIDAYKGAGAYYTLKNLVMFHNCGIKLGNLDVLFSASAVAFLNEKLDEYHGDGWRMFALMKKVIADNNFDFNARMKEIYNK